MAACCYIWFRKTDGDENIPKETVTHNAFNGAMAYNATTLAHADPTNYAPLETTTAQHNAMEANISANGTYGYHVDLADSENPVLTEGDPA